MAAVSDVGGDVITDKLRFELAPTLQDPKLFEHHFTELALFLINKCVVMIHNIPHRFIELEFYFCGHAHMDEFTHRDEMQLTHANWYFHKNGGKYKGGSFKGLDLTFGPIDSYGGILIRGMQNLNTDEIIDGPSLCVDNILKLNGASSIEEFVNKEGTTKAVLDPGESSRGLYVVGNDQLQQVTPLCTPRVGLTLKNATENKIPYLMQEYRYLAFPHLTKKGKHLSIIALHRNGVQPPEIARATKSTAASVRKAINLYDSGTRLASIGSFVDATLKNDDVCALYGFCSRYLPHAKC